MRGLLYIVVALVALVAVGCSGGGERVSLSLDEAQRLMSVDPEAAFERLNALDVASMDDSAVVARWALLYSEALAANSLTAPSDSIIDIAIDYYGARDAVALQRAEQLKQAIGRAGAADRLVTARYLQKEKEFMLYKERQTRRRIVGAAVLAVLLAAGIIVWQRQRLRLKELQAETLMAEASTLRDNMASSRTRCDALQQKLESTLGGRFAVIDNLCSTYYESQGTKVERKAIVQQVVDQIDSMRRADGMFAEMERAVDDCTGGVLAELRSEMPDLKTDDYRLVVFLLCRLSNRSIALLLDQSVDTIYKRKSRLKSRLSCASAPVAARILAMV